MSDTTPAPTGYEDLDDDTAFRKYRETRSRGIRNMLVERHRGFAYHLADRYANRGVPRDDLRQIGVIGLVKSVERFDPDHGAAFLTFARPYIIGELRHHFRDATWSVQVPRPVKELAGKVRRAIPQLQQQLEREPRVEEIAEHLGVEVENVLDAMDAGAAHRTRPVESSRTDDDLPVAIPSEDERGFGDIEREMLIADLLETLEERERTILELRFYDELTQREIGERVGVSQMHVSRLIRRSLAELQERLLEQQADAESA